MVCCQHPVYSKVLDGDFLSIKNDWIDDQGRVYIFFSVEDVMEQVGCGKNKAIKCLKELDMETGIGLIQKHRQGLGKANIIYVRTFVPDEKQTSESPENKLPDVCKGESNKTNKSNNNRNNNKSHLILIVATIDISGGHSAEFTEDSFYLFQEEGSDAAKLPVIGQILSKEIYAEYIAKNKKLKSFEETDGGYKYFSELEEPTYLFMVEDKVPFMISFGTGITMEEADKEMARFKVELYK